MAASSSRAAALALMLMAATSSVAHAQNFGLAAGPAVEHGASTGAMLQLSWFTKTAFSHVGLRFDGLYLMQPGRIIEGSAQEPHTSFQSPSDHTYGVLAAVRYQVGNGAVRPYALFGTGFYDRNAYTAGFTLGMNAGLGAELRVGRLQMFGEARLHQFRGPANVSWTTTDRVRFIPVTLGVRF